ncbi:Uncharacterised protein [Mycobacterium tuberculosis]|nr:Uncharacterised protein [Mycobacterium tuberculosis]COX07960.1 Uncharacterised protein [Mycobacterium tuberculosis]COX29920.1 Uncharacterised protein [Mycobacterium tuberculosis]COZ42091.1 Uncharacterised protein [Mycobacterium tuberculosis]CPA36744.1 Uncharacterised protein [Mycobacterium tuberculosis]
MSLRKLHCGTPGLGARPLFDKQELAAGVVGFRIAQVDHHLQRKHQLAVEILV